MQKHVVILFLIWCCIGCLTDIQVAAAQQLPANAITVEAVVQRLQEKQDLMLVDVRDSREFERVSIPGSLNIPLFAVNTKAFLKDKPLVLVDEGYRPRQLEETCEQLRQAGFDARFLFGGLNAWRMRSATRRWASPSRCRPSGSLPRSAYFNVPLQGNVFAQNALNKMPPQALSAEQAGEHWLLIDVSAGKETHLLPGGDLFWQAVSVPFEHEKPEPFLARLEQAVADAIDQSEAFLVLFYNRYGEDYKEIECVLQNTHIAPVFFLTKRIFIFFLTKLFPPFTPSDTW